MRRARAGGRHRELSFETPPAPGGSPPTVDGALLAWAVSFIAEQTRDLLGSVMTAALLRRTWTRLLKDHESLRSLRVAADGRVLVDHERAALPASAVPAVASWVTSFLAEASALAERAGKVRIRQATRMMESGANGFTPPRCVSHNGNAPGAPTSSRLISSW